MYSFVDVAFALSVNSTHCVYHRTSDLSGSAFQYLFSHSGVVPTLDNWRPNQVSKMAESPK